MSRKKFFFIESKKKEWKCKFISYYIKNTNDVMIVCKWSTLTSQRPLENDHKTQQIWQIRHEKTEWFTRFSELKENRVDHTFWLHLRKNKQKMKTGWTTHSWNKAIWLALSLCHMTMMRKINKLEKPGRPQGNFHALFGRSAAFYGHFWVDTVTSEWSTHISPSTVPKRIEHITITILIHKL